jgi:NADH-quinone oxidoreductase subunit E
MSAHDGAKTISIAEIELPTWPEQCKAEVEAILAKYPEDREKSAIMPLLHLAMRERQGRFVALSDMQAIAEIVGTSSAYVDSVCSFYAMYHRHPIGKYLITVCGSMVCHLLSGGRQLVEHIEQSLGIKNGETTTDGLITLELTPECLAACDQAPVMHVNVEYAVKVTPARFDALVADLQAGKGPEAFIEKLPLMSAAVQSDWKGFTPPPAPSEPEPEPEAAPDAEAAAESEAAPDAEAAPAPEGETKTADKSASESDGAPPAPKEVL